MAGARTERQSPHHARNRLRVERLELATCPNCASVREISGSERRWPLTGYRCTSPRSLRTTAPQRSVHSHVCLTAPLTSEARATALTRSMSASIGWECPFSSSDALPHLGCSTMSRRTGLHLICKSRASEADRMTRPPRNPRRAHDQGCSRAGLISSCSRLRPRIDRVASCICWS
jgi:hypothetical protein